MKDYDRYADDRDDYDRDDDYDRNDDDRDEGERRRLPHSGLGVASFATALIVAVFEFAVIAAACYLTVSQPGGLDEKSPEAIFLGLGIIGGGFIAVVGMVIGIAGLSQPRRSKTYAALGVAINALTILGLIALIAIGLAVGDGPPNP